MTYDEAVLIAGGQQPSWVLRDILDRTPAHKRVRDAARVLLMRGTIRDAQRLRKSAYSQVGRGELSRRHTNAA